MKGNDKMDVPKFSVFETRFNDEELENEFHAFFYKNNLTALFTDEHRASPISVTYVDAKSVVNESGQYARMLKELAEVLTIGNDNKSFQEAMFRTIHEPKSFQSFMNHIKRLIDYIKSIDENHKHNLWNIVWYNKDLK